MSIKVGSRHSLYPHVITHELPPHLVGGSIGLDLEWDESGKPSIIGIAARVEGGWKAWSVPWQQCKNYWETNNVGDTVERLMQILGSVDEIVGHSIITSDVPALQQHLPFPIIPQKQFDTLVYFYLTNAHLCKARAEKPTESKYSPSERTIFEQESKGGGFMSLWTMASMYTDLPNWKQCHGELCNSLFDYDPPCPTHQPFQYNGIDALAPLMCRDQLEREAKLKHVDHLVPLLSRVSRIAAQMSSNGVCVDEDWLGKLELKMEQQKTLIKEDLPTHINWNSPQQIMKFFKDKYGFAPQSTSEEDIEQFYEDHGFDEAGTLLELKQSGRGLKAWFDRRFIHDGLLHPRFIPVGGTATGRWASARPNFQSIPVRRAADVRKIIIARPGYDLFSADYKQAEARAVLKLAGYDVPADGSFKQFVLNSLQFDPNDPGVKHLGGEWNAAKSVAHACVTPETEVLTESGWQEIGSYSGGRIAQWEHKQGISFVEPIKYHKYPFQGSMDVLMTRGLSAQVTPNHAFPVISTGTWRGKRYDTLHRLNVSQFISHGSIPVSDVLEDQEEIYSDIDIQKAVAVQADARYSHGKYASFHIVKPRKQRRLETLFGLVGKSCGCHPTGKRYHMTFQSPLLSASKSFTPALLKLSQRQREIFLDEILNWDGSRGKSNKAYCNTDYTSVRWVQTVAHLSGRQALVRPGTKRYFYTQNPKDIWKVSFNKRRFASIETMDVSKEMYSGDVYCFTVPSGYFLIRHKDRISITGNSHYGEGLVFLTQAQLNSPYYLNMSSQGALEIYPDWKYDGKIVCCTGVNMAARMFGRATYENRKKALDLRRRYFQKFPGVLDWQKSVSRSVERDGYVQSAFGFYLMLYGYAFPKLKTALAMLGSNPVAFFTNYALCNADNDGVHPVAQVHDELLWELPQSTSDGKAIEMITGWQEIECKEMPGFKIPVEISRGKSWGEQENIYG